MFLKIFVVIKRRRKTHELCLINVEQILVLILCQVGWFFFLAIFCDVLHLTFVFSCDFYRSFSNIFVVCFFSTFVCLRPSRPNTYFSYQSFRRLLIEKRCILFLQQQGFEILHFCGRSIAAKEWEDHVKKKKNDQDLFNL